MQDKNIPDQQSPDPSTLPTGSQLFREWLKHEGSKSWDALDTSPDGNYEKVWQAWLQSGADLEVVFTEVELPILGGRYLLPSSLSRSSRLRALTPLLPTR